MVPNNPVVTCNPSVSMIFSPSICHREKLLAPILPERGLAMLYAPRGIGKTFLGISIGLSRSMARASATPCALRRWRNALGVLAGAASSNFVGLGVAVPNDGFRVLAGDSTERAGSTRTCDPIFCPYPRCLWHGTLGRHQMPRGVVPLGSAWVGRCALASGWNSPDRKPRVPTGLVIAASRNAKTLKPKVKRNEGEDHAESASWLR